MNGDDDLGDRVLGEFEYSDVIEFKNALAERKDDFHRGFTRYLLTYALGRHLEAYDERTVEELVTETDGKGLRDLVVAIAKSYPFRHTRNHE